MRSSGTAVAADRQAPDPDARFSEHHNRACIEVVGDGIEIGQQEGNLLLGPALGTPAEEDEG